jgi:sodium-dependent dicarboxylate transporter 2/3/5
MATPIGSGPNAIAIAATQAARPITFVHWMAFGTPITFGMLSLGFALIVLLYGVRGKCDITIEAPRILSTKAKGLLWLFALTIAAWLSEPFHHVNASLVALAVTLLLFATGLLTKRDLGALDWSTLGLIAGGLGLGRLLENTGLLTDLTASIMGTDYPRWVTLGGLVFASATLAALMSNTATAALLVPLGLQLHGGSSTAIIIAIAASFGMPFPISTPPNALVYGTGSLRVADLLVLGLVVMVIGCVVVTLTGAGFLSWLSID